MSDFTREERWALLAAAEGEELIELAGACLAAAGEFTVSAPPLAVRSARRSATRSRGSVSSGAR